MEESVETSRSTHDVEPYRSRYDSENLYVLQANDLIRSKQDTMSLMEIKLIRFVISQITKYTPEDKPLMYTCEISKLADVLGVDAANIYRFATTSINQLMGRIITITNGANPQEWQKFHWVSYAEYKNGKITICIDEALAPYLVRLSQFFTMYGYTDIVSLPSSNSIRLFELLHSYVNMELRPNNKSGEVSLRNEKRGVKKDAYVFSIDWLRDYMNCAESYPLTANFIKRVIDPSVDAINKNTTLRVTYSTIKTGKKITALSFRFHRYSSTTPTEDSPSLGDYIPSV